MGMQKFGNAVAGATRLLEAKMIMITCAQHDAANFARLRFRQSRPALISADDLAEEEDVKLTAEKRFTAVRTVMGRPTREPTEGDDDFMTEATPDYEARRLRAYRLMFDPVLWPTPPPDPKQIPPVWMNALRPGLADPEDAFGDAITMGARVVGVDPSKGERGAPRSVKGLNSIGPERFLKGRPIHQRPGDGGSLAMALVALRRDVAYGRPAPNSTDDPSRTTRPRGFIRVVAAARLQGTPATSLRETVSTERPRPLSAKRPPHLPQVSRRHEESRRRAGALRGGRGRRQGQSRALLARGHAAQAETIGPGGSRVYRLGGLGFATFARAPRRL